MDGANLSLQVNLYSLQVAKSKKSSPLEFKEPWVGTVYPALNLLFSLALVWLWLYPGSSHFKLKKNKAFNFFLDFKESQVRDFEILQRLWIF